MRKILVEALFALAAFLAAGTTKLISAQYRVKVPPRQTVRTTATFTSLVYGAPPSYLWIMIKWGPGKDDFVHAQLLPSTRILENGRPAPKSALCPTPTGPNCGNVSVRVTGYYYGQLNLGTNFSATEIVILSAAPARSAGPPPPSGGYHPPAYTGSHPPAAANNPPAAQTGQAPAAGRTSLTGTIQALRPGYFELSVPGRAPLWVREFGARITQNGRTVVPNFLRVGESVQVQGRMVGIQLWATDISVLPAQQAPGSGSPASQSPASSSAPTSPFAPGSAPTHSSSSLASGGSQGTSPSQADLKREQMQANQAYDRFLAYKAQLQLQRIDRHISLLNALLKNPACVAGCRTALQSGLASDNQVKFNIRRTMQPIENLNDQLRHFLPPRELSGGPAISPRGGTAGPGNSPARGGASGSCTAPQISSLSPSQGQPGDLIMINGTGFTDQADPQIVPSITMIVGGVSYGLGETFINDSQVLVGVPGPTGVQAQTAYLYVATCQNSNSVPFQFEPELSLEQLPIGSGDASFADFTCGIDKCGSAPWVFPSNAMFPQYAGLAGDSVNAGVVTGRRGDDQFFSDGYQLKNGWVLDSVSFASLHTATSRNGCTLQGDTIGSTSPAVDVHCWVSPNRGQAGYSLGIYIHGPKGVPYQ